MKYVYLALFMVAIGLAGNYIRQAEIEYQTAIRDYQQTHQGAGDGN